MDKLKSSTSFEDLVLCELPEKQFAILKYALKLTQTPGDIDAEDVTLLRECGLNDRAIHDVCAITAYFAFVNRIADGLGVELEETDR
ncbi:MAG: peroxidase [Planctomycetota bacterium]